MGVQNADMIDQLPVDKTPPSYNEIRIVDTLFKYHSTTMNSVFKECKDSLLIGILFVTFSLPHVDATISRVWPITETSPYMMILAKAVIIMALFWLVKHFYLSRKTL